MSSPVVENEFLAELRGLVADVLDLDEEVITLDANFVDDLGVDSLMALELMVTLEREYQLTLTEEDLREMVCLRNLSDFLVERINLN